MSDFIGIVDLTVRHSSMNPFGHIDVHEASATFEQAVLYACRHMLERHGSDTDIGRRMRERGIVNQGPAAKYFHFEAGEDAMEFAVKVRARLLEKGLPFKLCLARGSLGVEDLEKTWTPVLHEALSKGDAGRKAKDRILFQFGTDKKEVLGDIFQVYKAPGLHQDAISLALDLDAFKGFGIWIDPRLTSGSEAIHDERLFRNYQPVRIGGVRQRWEAREFVDLRLSIDTDDVVVRRPGAEPELMISSREPMIVAVLDLLRRSMKAGEENAVFYVSLLTTIVRSSSYGQMRELKSSLRPDGDEGLELAKGWQYHPPAFHLLVLDPVLRPILRRMQGLDLVLAAMIDEIHSAFSGEPPSCGLADYRRPSQATPAARAEQQERLRAVSAPGTPFAAAVRQIESVFGEALLRRIRAVPSRVLNEERKRAALHVTTAR
jgi:hypothetical protein